MVKSVQSVPVEGVLVNVTVEDVRVIGPSVIPVREVYAGHEMVLAAAARGRRVRRKRRTGSIL